MTLHKTMVSIGPIEFINLSNVIIHALWLLPKIFKCDDFFKMERRFLLPVSWKDLKNNPFCFFGSAFSHADTVHLSANLAAFSIFAPLAIDTAGASRFSHLYLISTIISQTAAGLWENNAPDFLKKNAQYSLGASGAISGVIAYVCMLHKESGYVETDDGKEVPLIYWFVGYVLSDVAGLLREDTLLETSKLIVEGDIRGALSYVSSSVVKRLNPIESENESGTSERENIENLVGYDAHLGGVLGGIIFHLVSVYCPLESGKRFLWKFSRKHLPKFITSIWFQKILDIIKVSTFWIGLMALAV
mmetsp:Transcript_27958/g.36180  ORF Transcript_27958/g.36180 Transcript_27958/m.36180 type:complete len:303 (+) Transcript_27958:1-909(+)